jgi:hypothetical protein
VVAHRPLDDVRGQRGQVVRAEQPPAGTVVEREVQQRLVERGLVDLDVATARPDRFTDAAHRARVTGVLEEAPPLGDDAGRVRPELGHVDEVRPHRVGAEGPLDDPELLGDERDEDRLAAGDALADERHDGALQVIDP